MTDMFDVKTKEIIEHENMVLLQYNNQGFYLYDKELKMLVSLNQTGIEKEHRYDVHIIKKQCMLNNVSCNVTLVNIDHAVKLFSKLARIPAFDTWEISSRMWFVGGMNVYGDRSVYNGKKRTIEKLSAFHKPHILRVIYLKEELLGRNNTDKKNLEKYGLSIPLLCFFNNTIEEKKKTEYVESEFEDKAIKKCKNENESNMQNMGGNIQESRESVMSCIKNKNNCQDVNKREIKKDKIIVEITYNSRGLNQIIVGDIDFGIEPIRRKSIEEWFIPFKGRVSWKGLIAEIKEVLQDDDVEFEFEFFGRDEYKSIFENCLKKMGLLSENNIKENKPIESEEYKDDKRSTLNLDDILRKAKRLENLGKRKEALEQYSILAQQGHADGEYKAAEIRKELLGNENHKHSENEKYQIFLLFEAAANQGHSEAMNCLAECYRDGYGVDENPADAVLWFEKGANAGNIDAVRNLGKCYYNGYGVDENIRMAADWFEKGIQYNDAESYLYLGGIYINDENDEKDEKKAELYFKRAAELGNPTAQCYYGYLYLDGEERIKWVKMAAEQNLPIAQFFLGAFYLEGDGVKKDTNQAIALLRMSAEQECGEAQFMLGLCYYNGNGVEEDDDKAFQWFDKAAENDSIEAVFYLGNCYMGGYGVEENEKMAFEMYTIAADAEHDDAQFCLGECYKHGIGVERDLQMAFEWYKRSADNGNAEAQCMLGACYFSAIGVEENKEEAMKYYNLAAEQEFGDAQFMLGICCYNDDKDAAFQWFHKAVLNGSIDAMFYLGKCYMYGYGVKKNEEKAVEYYTLAAEKGNAEAQRNLGICYISGDGVEKDKKEALKWLIEAANQDDSFAQTVLGDCFSGGDGFDKDDEKAVFYYRKAAEQGESTAYYSLGWHYAYGVGVDRNDDEAFYWLKKAGDDEDEKGDLICAVAEIYDYLLMPEYVRNKIIKEAEGSFIRSLAGAGMSIAGVFVGGPLWMAGLAASASSIFGGARREKEHYQNILSTKRGKEMLAFFEKAARLGSEDAEKKVKKLRKY